MTKVKAHQIRSNSKTELLKTLEEYKKELSSLRIAQVTNGPPAKLARIKVVRKSIARVLTVINQTTKEKLREKFSTEKTVPRFLRKKLTRAIRRRLTPEQQAKKTVKQQKKESNFPQRVFALKA